MFLFYNGNLRNNYYLDNYCWLFSDSLMECFINNSVDAISYCLMLPSKKWAWLKLAEERDRSNSSSPSVVHLVAFTFFFPLAKLHSLHTNQSTSPWDANHSTEIGVCRSIAQECQRRRQCVCFVQKHRIVFKGKQRIVSFDVEMCSRFCNFLVKDNTNYPSSQKYINRLSTAFKEDILPVV